MSFVPREKGKTLCGNGEGDYVPELVRVSGSGNENASYVPREKGKSLG